MKKPIIAFIGAGHMGGALIGGLIHTAYPATHIWAACPTLAHLQTWQTRFAIHTTTHNVDAVKQADIVVLAVKPQILPGVLTQLRECILQHKPLLISVVAGVSEAYLQQVLDAEIAVVRAMPNTPALVGHGATVLHASSLVSVQQKQQADAIFAAVGTTFWLDDEQFMNAVTALSGSGPAYFFLLMEALEEAGVMLGLPALIARPLVAQTALGAASMALGEVNPVALRQQVTSKGGVTERALEVLAQGRFKELMCDALKAAKERCDVILK